MVNLVEGGQRAIEELKVGDQIWSLTRDGTSLIKDEVLLMADNGPNKTSKQYLFCMFDFVINVLQLYFIPLKQKKIMKLV
jgi:hypothetical protein